MTSAARAVSDRFLVEQPKAPVSWVELCCLNCGELAGYIENAHLVKPVVPGRIRIEGCRLRCGRCDGMLLSGERGVASSARAVG
jgi:hypothetical protein